MSREQIVHTTYQAVLGLNRHKANHGSIPGRVAAATEERIKCALEMLQRIDEIVAGPDREEQLAGIKATVDRVNSSTVCEKGELELPITAITLRPLRTLWSLVKGRY